MAFKTEFIRIELDSNISEHFNKSKYPNQDKILLYLKKGRQFLYTPHKIFDPITGALIARECYSRTDETYSWTDILIYIIDKYNYRLPIDIENHILENLASK
ncbi:MAG: hypothetical protein ACI35S_05300 [Anaeroplasma sp.]